jgi:hypothetical protein
MMESLAVKYALSMIDNMSYEDNRKIRQIIVNQETRDITKQSLVVTYALSMIDNMSYEDNRKIRQIIVNQEIY